MGWDFEERRKAAVARYERMFKERGGITPSDPLQFHLYHLSLYWGRLVGFCRQTPDRADAFINTDVGVCVAVASEFADQAIERNPLQEQWQDYWFRTQAILYHRPVTLEDIEAASRAFDDCLRTLNYDPFSRT